MPRTPKAVGNRTPGETVPRQFRLRQETIDDLDVIADTLYARDGVPRTLANAIRFAARQAAEKIRKNNSKMP